MKGASLLISDSLLMCTAFGYTAKFLGLISDERLGTSGCLPKFRAYLRSNRFVRCLVTFDYFRRVLIFSFGQFRLFKLYILLPSELLSGRESNEK